jgi:hypothetical protein
VDMGKRAASSSEDCAPGIALGAVGNVGRLGLSCSLAKAEVCYSQGARTILIFDVMQSQLSESPLVLKCQRVFRLVVPTPLVPTPHQRTLVLMLLCRPHFISTHAYPPTMLI